MSERQNDGSEVERSRSDVAHDDDNDDDVFIVPPVPTARKSSRRSPTTGHRRKKIPETKRSHSSPRELIVPTSSDDDTGQKPVTIPARKSVSPAKPVTPPPEPKKTLRRRTKSRPKEKADNSFDDTSSLNTDLEVKLDANIEDSKKKKNTKIKKTTDDNAIIKEEQPVKRWWSWLGWRKPPPSPADPSETSTRANGTPVDEDLSSDFAKIVAQTNLDPVKISWIHLIKESRVEFRKFVNQYPNEVEVLKKLRNRCACELLIIVIMCGIGAMVFKTTEGAFESFYKCGVKRVKRDFIDELWRSSHYMREDEWKSKARRKLWDFENQLQEAFEAGVTTYSGRKSWSFINGIIYCLTVITTIGYGHIAPVTKTGRALTIAYSIFGIPMFLILLTDFGKLFTRGMKFLWALVRRVYYTGSCKKVRRTAPVQEVMKGVQMMYDTLRRPSMFPQENGAGDQSTNPTTPAEAPPTPALSAFAIDDEFNLPISVAITILLGYIFLGATVFYIWEDEWSFFEAFYFVFISMSTIGFGDLVPKNQMYMMASIIYLVFGLSLTSMCINVVQEKLSDSFRKASAKIGATIGLRVCEDDGTISPVSPTHVEIADVHQKMPTGQDESNT